MQWFRQIGPDVGGTPRLSGRQYRQANQPSELVRKWRILGDKLGTALPLYEPRAYNAGEGLHRL
jgi:hypothetical protein